MFPIGLNEWKVATTHPILTYRFKNILRTFEAEILKIFKDVRPQPQNFNFKTFLYKKEYILKLMFQLFVLETAEITFTRYLSLLGLTANCALVGH